MPGRASLHLGTAHRIMPDYSANAGSEGPNLSSVPPKTTGFSPKLTQMLKDLTPQQREEAMRIAAKLLVRRAKNRRQAQQRLFESGAVDDSESDKGAAAQPELSIGRETAMRRGAKFSRRNGVRLDVVYCLSNEAMPGLFKIGFSTLTAAVRAKHLYEGYGRDYTTGVPVPFKVVKEWEVPSGLGEQLERAVHLALKERRPNPWREFFRFDDSSHAVAEIERALRQLDWYATAVAEAEQKRREAELRSARQMADGKARQRERDRQRAVLASVRQQTKLFAKRELRMACTVHGLKCGGIAGAALLIISALPNWHAPLYGFACIVGVVVFFLTRSTPLNQFLASSAFEDRVAAEVSKAMASEPEWKREASPTAIVETSAKLTDEVPAETAILDGSERKRQEIADIAGELSSMSLSIASDLAKSDDIVGAGDNATLYLGFRCGITSMLCQNAKLDSRDTEDVFIRLFMRTLSSRFKARQTYDGLATLVKDESFVHAVRVGKWAADQWEKTGGSPVAAGRCLVVLLGVKKSS